MKRQRHQYRAKKERKHSTLTQERQKLLEQLGFVWDSHASGWEERLKELEDFKEKHGHCRVPKTYAENPQLAIWVKVSAGCHHGMMGPPQGVVIVFFVSFLHLQERRTDFLSCCVASIYRCIMTHMPFLFHQCQRRQFKLYSEGKDSNMTIERIHKLRSLGFIFTPRKKHKESLLTL